MIFTPIKDLELLLNLKDEAELYAKISGKFKKLNADFWNKANLKLFEHLRLDRPARVLDLACGGGSFAIEMANKCPHLQIVGIDVHPEMLNQARRDAEASGVSSIEFIEHDFQHLFPDFQDGQFDLGICLFALSYLGVETGLKEMHRLLGSSGQVGITTSSLNSLTEWQPVVLQFFVEQQEKFGFSEIPTIPPQPLDAQDLKKRMEGAGFKNVYTESVKVPLSFPDIQQAVCFLISSTWLSKQVYSSQNKELRRFAVNGIMERLADIYPPGSEITFTIEFLVGWNEP